MAEAADAPALETPDFSAVLSARAGRRYGRIYKRGAGAFLDEFPVEKVPVDRGAMSATFWISRPNEDRSEDIVNPEGLILDNYRLNPVVFFDHGFGDITLPIGSSEAPDGSLAITVSPEGDSGTCYFSQSLRQAAEIFELVDEGILRAASPFIIEKEFSIRPGTGNRNRERPGLYIKSWDMAEWSIVGIPDNPEAIRKVLDRGKLAGGPISDPILKSLRATAALIPVQGCGMPDFTLSSLFAPRPTIMAMAKSLAKRAKDAADGDPDDMKRLAKEFEEREDVKRLTKEFSDSKEDESDKAKSRRKEIEDEYKRLRKDAGLTEDDTLPERPGETPTPEPRDEPADDESSPLGRQILKGTYSAISDLADQLDEITKPLENPAVKDYMGTMSEALRGNMADIEGLHKEQYPDHPELAKSVDSEPDGDEGGDGDMGSSPMQKFLARSKLHRQGVKGIARQLMQVSESKHIPKQFKSMLGELGRKLAGISKAAETRSPTVAAVDESGELAAMKKELAGIKQMITEAIPHRR